VAFACATGEWVAAVRCLLTLGKRQHLMQATHIAMSAEGAPSAKVGSRGRPPLCFCGAHCLLA